MNKLDGVSKYHKNDSVGLTSDANGHCTNHQDLDSLQCSTEKRADDMSEVSDESAGISVNENDRQYESLEPSLNNVAHCLNDNQIGDAQFVISTQTNGVSKESDEIGEGSLVTETSQGDKQKELVGACNAELTIPTIELEVETFPLRPAIKEIDGVSGTSTGLVDINGTLNNLGTKHNEISNGVPQFDKFASPDSLSAMVTAKGAGGSEHSTTVPDIVKQMAEIKNQVIQGEQADCTNKTLEMLPSSAVRDQSIPFDEGCVYKVASHSGSASNTMDQSEEIDELQVSLSETLFCGSLGTIKVSETLLQLG